MERNDDLPGGGSNAAGNPGAANNANVGGTSGYGDTGDFTGSQGYRAGTGGSSAGTGAYGATGGEQSSGLRDRLADAGSTVKDRAADLGSNVREKAGNAKNSLADILESGAERLRQRAHGSSTTPGTPVLAGDGNINATGEARVTQVGDKVAGGMQATADWLRDADLDSLKAGVERQVKDHPGRTLLIALGVGYVLGKAFRNNK